MRTRICLIGALMLWPALTVAQPAPHTVSLNISAGSVGSTSRVMPGAVAQLTVGTDVAISRNWQLRFEAGRRAPSLRSWEPRSLYYLPSPDNPSQPIEAQTVQRASEDTLADIAVLARRVWPVRERFEMAFLTGMDMSVVRHRHHLEIQRSLTDPKAVDVFDTTNVRTHMVLDLGVEAGVRFGGRWRALVYGIAGLQSPLEEHRRPQLRSGLTLKRLF
jgi:hypothetical protein